jgi:5'/3'-nucleotidase SurE
VTSIKYGISTLAPDLFANGSPPDLAVSGPNVGSNLGLVTLFSGTVGAATYAANSANIPAIAFSGSSGTQTAWNVSTGVPAYSQIYADLSTTLTTALIASGTPYLPQGIWLNVNFPDVSDSACNDMRDFEFVLSRIYAAIPLITPDDVSTCGSTRLPTETDVVGTTSGCFVSVSVGDASSKLDADATSQAVVLDKLSGLLTCLPSS